MKRISKPKLAVIAAVALAAVGIGIGVAISSTPSPPKATVFRPPSTINATCATDDTVALAAWIGAQKPGETLNFGKGCYLINGTMELRDLSGLTLKNGTFKQVTPDPDEIADPNPTGPTYCGSSATFPVTNYTLSDAGITLPIFFEGGCDILIRDLTFVGPNTDATSGDYKLEQDTAITFAGTQVASVTESRISGPLGDCIDVQPLHEVPGGDEYLFPATDVTVSDTSCKATGRQGMSVILGARIAFTHNVLQGIHDTAFDVEEDAYGGYETDINISDNTIVGVPPFDFSAITKGKIERLAFTDNHMAQMRFQIKDEYPGGNNVLVSGNTATAPDSGADFAQPPILIVGVVGGTVEVGANTFPLDKGRIDVPTNAIVCGNVLTPPITGDSGTCPDPSPIVPPAPPSAP